MFAETRNPFYAWQALGICLKYQKKIPGWLVAYLVQCIVRMQSDRAKRSGDLLKALPWVFGFPKKKPGPGNLLNPNRKPYDKALFAYQFAKRIDQGEKPLAALRNTCNEHFGQKRADIDEKTLKGWLVKAFDLEKWPRHAAEWKPIVHKHFDALETLRKHYSPQIRE
ncbi:hypothetical protein [Bradyrhizobium sp.]|uniref:hypothetical protein n=1 Tax=Bradyrhizobium sp. TaxID=376 RepID=UPI002C208376|nr:hypothetical protein [Bradyrhizobium sp.]HWX58783.1 hypothetical protein [Bradyrhizobium sp.]